MAHCSLFLVIFQMLKMFWDIPLWHKNDFERHLKFRTGRMKKLCLVQHPDLDLVCLRKAMLPEGVVSLLKGCAFSWELGARGARKVLP